MDKISLLLAFSAGLVSFLSPCVLPLVPAYISYLAGTEVADIKSNKDRQRILFRSIGFIIGFSIVFVLMGISVSVIGKILAENINILRKIGGLLIIVFGLHIMGVFKIKMLYSEKRLFAFDDNMKNIGSIFLGMAFAAGWTPCIGPILSSILVYAGSMETIGQGILLLGVYSMGLAVPFLLTAMLIGSFFKYYRKFSKYLPAVTIVSGVLMIIMGILMFTNRLTDISRYLNFI